MLHLVSSASLVHRSRFVRISIVDAVVVVVVVVLLVEEVSLKDANGVAALCRLFLMMAQLRLRSVMMQEEA